MNRKVMHRAEKRFVLFALVCTMIACMPPFTIAAAGRYDVNRDGSVNIADVSALLELLTEKTVKEQADANADGEVNVVDVTAILNCLSGGEDESLKLMHITSPVSRNETAEVTICGKPDTKYTIEVHYPSGVSKAKGLEDKASDAFGYVTWEWKIGGRTSLGEHMVRIIGGGNETETTIIITE